MKKQIEYLLFDSIIPIHRIVKEAEIDEDVLLEYIQGKKDIDQMPIGEARKLYHLFKIDKINRWLRQPFHIQVAEGARSNIELGTLDAYGTFKIYTNFMDFLLDNAHILNNQFQLVYTALESKEEFAAFLRDHLSGSMMEQFPFEKADQAFLFGVAKENQRMFYTFIEDLHSEQDVLEFVNNVLADDTSEPVYQVLEAEKESKPIKEPAEVDEQQLQEVQAAVENALHESEAYQNDLKDFMKLNVYPDLKTYITENQLTIQVDEHKTLDADKILAYEENFEEFLKQHFHGTTFAEFQYEDMYQPFIFAETADADTAYSNYFELVESVSSEDSIADFVKKLIAFFADAKESEDLLKEMGVK